MELLLLLAANHAVDLIDELKRLQQEAEETTDEE